MLLQFTQPYAYSLDSPGFGSIPTVTSTFFELALKHGVDNGADVFNRYTATKMHIGAVNYHEIVFPYPDDSPFSSLAPLINSTTKAYWSMSDTPVITTTDFFGPKPTTIFTSQIGDPIQIRFIYTGSAVGDDFKVPGEKISTPFAYNLGDEFAVATAVDNGAFITNLYDNHSVITVKLLFRIRSLTMVSGPSASFLCLFQTPGFLFDGILFTNDYPSFSLVRGGFVETNTATSFNLERKYLVTMTVTTAQISATIDDGINPVMQVGPIARPKYQIDRIQPGAVSSIDFSSGGYIEYTDILIDGV